MTDTEVPDGSGPAKGSARPPGKPAVPPSSQMTDPARAEVVSSPPTSRRGARVSLADMLIGTTLSGRYHLQRKLGEGAMGWVFLAEHTEIGKQYAVKVLRPALSRMRDAVGRFRREARAATQIGSKHIVDVSDFGTTDSGAVYMVMEYLAGGEDLRTTLERHGRLPWSRVVDIVLQCCDALQAAHDVDIIHRDVKPANLYRIATEQTEDFVKVLDFGIARLASPKDSIITATGMVMGTPDFMCPEQAQGRHVDHRADIYSLGASAYALLTGRPPFTGANEYDVIYKQLNEKARPPSELAPGSDIPKWLDAVILEAMAKDPDDRYQSMKELAEAIRRTKEKSKLAASESSRSDSVSAQASTSPSKSRSSQPLPVSPLMLMLGFVALAVVGAVAYVLLFSA